MPSPETITESLISNKKELAQTTMEIAESTRQYRRKKLI